MRKWPRPIVITAPDSRSWGDRANVDENEVSLLVGSQAVRRSQQYERGLSTPVHGQEHCKVGIRRHDRPIFA